MAQDNDPRQIPVFHPHGHVALVTVVCPIVARLLLWRQLVDKQGDLDGCLNTCCCRVCVWCLRGKTQEEVVETFAVATVPLSEEEHEKH